MGLQIFYTACIGMVIAVGLFCADFFLTTYFHQKKSSHVASFSAPVSDILYINLQKSFLAAFPNAWVAQKPDSTVFLQQFDTITLFNAPAVFQHWALYENRFSKDAFLSMDIAVLSPEISIASEYNTIQSQIKSKFSSPIQQIIELNKYPEKSFTIRLAENQKNMYIVIVFKNRLLGVSCDLSDILRFKSIDALLLQGLSSVL